MSPDRPTYRKRGNTSSFESYGLPGRFALAARTEIGEPRLLPLPPYFDRRCAAWKGSSPPPMDRVVLAGDRCHEVSAHQVAGVEVKPPQPVVIQRSGRHPGIQPKGPERLALIDVADAGADTLLQQQLTERGCLRAASAADDAIQIEWVDEDIRSEMGNRCLGIANQLHHGRGEANRHDVVKAQHRGGAPGRLAPALARSVEVPRAGHPHVRVQRDPAFEAHQEMLAIRFDGLDPSAVEAGDRRRAGTACALTLEVPPRPA